MRALGLAVAVLLVCGLGTRAEEKADKGYLEAVGGRGPQL